jgi:hypothetical protein
MRLRLSLTKLSSASKNEVPDEYPTASSPARLHRYADVAYFRGLMFLYALGILRFRDIREDTMKTGRCQTP